MPSKSVARDDTAIDPLNLDHRTPAREANGLTYPFEAPEPESFREIVPGVHWLRMPLPFSLDHINLYVLEGEEGWTIVDTGLRSRRGEGIWLRLLSEAMHDRPVERILVTHYHPDHVGLAGWLAEETDSPIWMSRGEFLTARMLLLDVRQEPPKEAVDFYRRGGLDAHRLDQFRRAGYGNYARIVHSLPAGYRRLQMGDHLKIGGRDWRVVIGSGHSPEHVCLYAEDSGILISGDQVLPRITSNVSVFPTEPEANPLADWFDSLDRLMDLPADTFVLPAHNEPFHGLRRRLNGLFEGHLEKLQGLAEFCDTPVTAVEAFPALFKREIDGSEFFMALGESLAHMHFLEQFGVLRRERGADADRFVTVRPFNPAVIRHRHEPAVAP